MSNTSKKTLSRRSIDIGCTVLRCLIVFLVPIITGIVIFKKLEISPFGSNDVLSIDLWGQYFPMYRKFAFDRGFSKAMYNWSGALGFNNWVQNAFYCRSIFLIPFQFIPTDYSITYIDIVCLLRFGLGALACQAFLEYRFESRSPLIMAVSICYGMCAYSTAFIMQFMWTDGLFLAPLVLLGLERFIRGKSPFMYCLMLALAIYSNFYTGFGICLFTGFYFLAEWLSRSYPVKDGAPLTVKEHLKERGKLFGRFALYSVLGALATAVMLLPTLKGLSNTESAADGKLNFTQWYHTMADNVAALLPDAPASLEYGTANIAVGIFAFILIPLFFMNTDIRFREKLAAGGFLGVLYMGLNYNPMDWVFNGFHFANQLPGRWSFLFSFALTIVAAHGLAKAKGVKLKSVLVALVIGVFFVGYSKYGNLSAERAENLSHWNRKLIEFAVLMAIGIVLGRLGEKLSAKAKKAAEENAEPEKSAAAISEAKTSAKEKAAAEKTGKKSSSQRLKKGALACRLSAFGMSLIVAAVMTVETCQNVYAVSTAEQAGIPRSGMDSFLTVSDVLYDLAEQCRCGDDDFYRTEALDGWTFNSAMIGDFNGIGYYGSTLNYGVYQLLQDMGNRVYARNVSTVYNPTSLFQNSLFGVKYILDRSRSFAARSGQGYTTVSDGEHGLIWENQTAFPIAFAVSKKIFDCKVDPEEIRAITTQNDMLNKMWGEQIDVFERITTEFVSENSNFSPSEDWNTNYFTRIDESAPVRFVWTYVVPDDSPLYIEQNFRAGTLIVNDTDQIDIGAEKFRCIGSYPAGTQLRIEYTCENVNIGCFGLELYRFNMEKWNEVYSRFSSRGLDVTSFKNTKLTGTLTVEQPEMIFTSIPQDGGWDVYVDNKKIDNFKTLGTLLAFNVSAGEHTITFRYHTPAFAAGLFLTVLAWLLIALCCLIFRMGGIRAVRTKLAKPAAETAENPAEDSGETTDSEEPEEET